MVDGDLDDAVGVVHVKQAFTVAARRRRSTRLGEIAQTLAPDGPHHRGIADQRHHRERQAKDDAGQRRLEQVEKDSKSFTIGQRFDL